MKKFTRTSILLLLWGSLSVTSVLGNDELLKACAEGKLDVVKSLVEKGADVNYANGQGATALASAVFWPEIVQYLVDKGARANDGAFPALVHASGKGSYQVMQILLNAGADPNKAGEVNVAAAMEKMVADEKAKGKGANKILIKAYEGQIEKLKATPNKIYAISSVVTSSNCKECLELLIEKGAKTDNLNFITKGNLLDEYANSGMTPAERVEGNKFNAPYFEKAGVVIPDWYKNPDPAKMGTAEDFVKILVKAGVNINLKNTLGDTPLLTALGYPTRPKTEIALALVTNGADVNVENIRNGHALIQAAATGSVPLLDAMISKGANLNAEFKVDDDKTGQRLKGITPLMWAAKNGHLEAVKYLVGKDAGLNETAHGTAFNVKTGCLTTVKDKTPLFFAIESGNLEIIKFLVEGTKKYWGQIMTIDQWKQRSEQDAGLVTIVKTSCYKDGAYLPSNYAKEMGFMEIKDYLKGKKL